MNRHIIRIIALLLAVSLTVDSNAAAAVSGCTPRLRCSGVPVSQSLCNTQALQVRGTFGRYTAIAIGTLATAGILGSAALLMPKVAAHSSNGLFYLVASLGSAFIALLVSYLWPGEELAAFRGVRNAVKTIVRFPALQVSLLASVSTVVFLGMIQWLDVAAGNDAVIHRLLLKILAIPAALIVISAISSFIHFTDPRSATATKETAPPATASDNPEISKDEESNPQAPLLMPKPANKRGWNPQTFADALQGPPSAWARGAQSVRFKLGSDTTGLPPLGKKLHDSLEKAIERHGIDVKKLSASEPWQATLQVADSKYDERTYVNGRNIVVVVSRHILEPGKNLRYTGAMRETAHWIVKALSGEKLDYPEEDDWREAQVHVTTHTWLELIKDFGLTTFLKEYGEISTGTKTVIRELEDIVEQIEEAIRLDKVMGTWIVKNIVEKVIDALDPNDKKNRALLSPAGQRAGARARTEGERVSLFEVLDTLKKLTSGSSPTSAREILDTMNESNGRISRSSLHAKLRILADRHVIVWEDSYLSIQPWFQMAWDSGLAEDILNLMMQVYGAGGPTNSELRIKIPQLEAIATDPGFLMEVGHLIGTLLSPILRFPKAALTFYHYLSGGPFTYPHHLEAAYKARQAAKHPAVERPRRAAAPDTARRTRGEEKFFNWLDHVRSLQNRYILPAILLVVAGDYQELSIHAHNPTVAYLVMTAGIYLVVWTLPLAISVSLIKSVYEHAPADLIRDPQLKRNLEQWIKDYKRRAILFWDGEIAEPDFFTGLLAVASTELHKEREGLSFDLRFASFVVAYLPGYTPLSVQIRRRVLLAAAMAQEERRMQGRSTRQIYFQKNIFQFAWDVWRYWDYTDTSHRAYLVKGEGEDAQVPLPRAYRLRPLRRAA